MLVFVTDRRDFGRTLASLLRERGIYMIQCPTEVALFTCERYDTGGVLLDAVSDLRLAGQLCAQLRQTYPEIPIAIIASPLQEPDLQVERILRDTEDLQSLAQTVSDFYRVDCGWSFDVFSVYHLTVGIDRKQTVYMGYRLMLTPSEHTVLRYLFYRAPRVTAAEELLAVCFPDGTQGKANLAVHVASINKKAALLYPTPLIVNHYGKGYRLRDGLT